MTREQCEEHEARLRSSYVKAHPALRYKTIRDRIDNPSLLSNQLVTVVAAVEALARSLVLHFRSPVDREAEYNKVKWKNPTQLLEMLCAGPPIEKGPAEVFGAQIWTGFACAERYRNLLVHECTCLRQGISSELIGACDEVLETLRSMSERQG